MSLLRELRAGAETKPTVDLCPREPHAAGMGLGLAALALGVWSARAGAQAAGWVALAGLLASMVLFQRWRVPGPGWRVDFERRRVEPVGQPGEPVDVRGAGWQLRTGPGDKFGLLAIDLMHDDRGRVARLLEHMALVRGQRRQLLALADALARRLGVRRTEVR